MGAIFRCVFPYQLQGPVLVPVGPHFGVVTLVLHPGQASDWPVCVNVVVLPIHELETCSGIDVAQQVCVSILTMLSGSFCKSRQLLSCLLPPEVPWQPEACSRHPGQQFPGQLSSSGSEGHVITD